MPQRRPNKKFAVCCIVSVIVYFIAIQQILISSLIGDWQPATPETKLALLSGKLSLTTCGRSESLLSQSSYSVHLDWPGCESNNSKQLSSREHFPIFLIVRDRSTVLKDMIASLYHTLSHSTDLPFSWELVVIDNNTTNPETLKYLESLELSGQASVKRSPSHERRRRRQQQHTASSSLLQNVLVDSVQKHVHAYLSARLDVNFYIVSDPDISLWGCQSDVLLFFAAVLSACPRLEQIGPSLRISDIPLDYPKRKEVLKQELKFWNQLPPYSACWRGNIYHIAEQHIDTTFSMRRRTTAFERRQLPAMRSYAPFMAIHTPWYSASGAPDDVYYMEHLEVPASHYTLH